MKTLSLKQIFDAVDYAPTLLPPTKAVVLDVEQVRKIIDRFAADDAAVFNFLHSEERCKTLSQWQQAADNFNYYASTPLTQYTIKLSSRQQLKITAADTSGWSKTSDLIDLVQKALKCRKAIEQADSPLSPEVVQGLRALSKKAIYTSLNGLNLSNAHYAQIKNLALPVNAIDRKLERKIYLNNIYAHRFLSETVRCRKAAPKSFRQRTSLSNITMKM
ncbi:MAG: hypothetical protein ACQEQL_02230 [Pseudomonadota bacterium]